MHPKFRSWRGEMRNSHLLKESKIFDPRDSLTAAYGSDLVDASVTKRGEHWWMVLAGQPGGYGATDLYSAYLPKGAALSASGWTPLLDGAGQLAPLSARNKSALWDGNGGRHSSSYVQGWDPHKKAWVERIYYGGAAETWHKRRVFISEVFRFEEQGFELITPGLTESSSGTWRSESSMRKSVVLDLHGGVV